MNHTLENLLRYLVGDKPKGWDIILPQEEFAYNNYVNKSTSKSPFQIVYGNSLRISFELRQLDKEEISSVEVEEFAKNLKNNHEEVRKHIIKMNV